MKRCLVLAIVAAGTGCGATLLYGNYPRANAQTLAEACNAQCAQKNLDALRQRVSELEHAMDKIALETSQSIKTGQRIVLRTDSVHGGGCLTYNGPSGDQGGYVSWNVNCSRGTSWIINELTPQQRNEFAAPGAEEYEQSGLARRNFKKLQYQALGQVSMPVQKASVNAPVLQDNEPAASSTAWSDTSNTSIASSLLGSISPK